MANFDAVNTAAEAARLVVSQGFAVLNVGPRVQWQTAEPIFAGLRFMGDLPAEVKELLRVDRSMNGDPDDGFLIRDPSKKNPGTFDATRKADRKHVWMHRKGVRDVLVHRGLMAGGEWNPFFGALDTLRDVSIEIATEVAKEIDAHTDGQWELHRGVLRYRGQSKLRAQYYLGGRDDDPETIAREHPDRSGLTVHLLEDHPGLMIRTWGGEVRLVPARPGRVIVFAGSQLQALSGGTEHRTMVGDVEQYTVTGGSVPALLHGACLHNVPDEPWPGTRGMCVGFVKVMNDPHDRPFIGH